MSDRNHYQVLGVSPTAATPQIRTAYRQLAYLLHPDRQSDSTEAERALAERRMREVNAAWATLSDDSRRTDYDRTLHRQRQSSGSSSADSSGTATSGTGPAASRSRAAGFGTAGSGQPGSRADGTRSTASSASSSRGRHSSAGSSDEWWDSDDPDAAFLQARAAELDPDEPDLSASQHWLLRRGPIVLVLVVGLVIFVASAYAGRSTGDPATATTPPPPVVADSNCVKFFPDGVAAYNVSCDGRFDATIVRELPGASSVGTCSAEGLKYASMRNKFFCVDPS